MKLVLIAVAAALLLASLASADEPPKSLRAQIASYGVLLGGQVADGYTTHSGMWGHGGHCVEANSGVYGVTPDAKRIVIVKALTVAPVIAVTAWADHKGAHRAANWGRIAFGAFGAGFAVRNQLVCH